MFDSVFARVDALQLRACPDRQLQKVIDRRLLTNAKRVRTLLQEKQARLDVVIEDVLGKLMDAQMDVEYPESERLQLDYKYHRLLQIRQDTNKLLAALSAVDDEPDVIEDAALMP